MDTPLADAVHKENVHVGGGKTTTMRKPVKLKPAGKKSKTLAKFKVTYEPSSRVTNNVDLKPMVHGKQQIAGADLFNTKNQIVNRASKVANLNTYSVSRDNFEMWRPLNHASSDEKIKENYDWAKEEDWGCSCSLKDEQKFYHQSLIWEFALEPNLSNNNGYEIDDPDLLSLLFISDEEREAEC